MDVTTQSFAQWKQNLKLLQDGFEALVTKLPSGLKVSALTHQEAGFMQTFTRQVDPHAWCEGKMAWELLPGIKYLRFCASSVTIGRARFTQNRQLRPGRHIGLMMRGKVHSRPVVRKQASRASGSALASWTSLWHKHWH
jgi:hypothetical protein